MAGATKRKIVTEKMKSMAVEFNGRRNFGG
jgi:hypothetical protein